MYPFVIKYVLEINKKIVFEAQTFKTKQVNKLLGHFFKLVSLKNIILSSDVSC